MTNTDDGYYKLQPVHAPGKALDVEATRSANSTKVKIWESDNSNAQKWAITPVPEGGGYYHLSPAPGSNLDVAGAKTANGTKVQLSGFTISSSQKWRLVPATTSDARITNMPANAVLKNAGNIPAGKVYPNPVGDDGMLYLNLPSSTASNSAILLFDMTGKNVYRTIKALIKGVNYININISSLPAGTYILQIRHGVNNEQYKVIKK